VPDITPNGYLDIKKELDNLNLYKYHPNGILNVSFNRLTDYLDGKVEIVDPSNPFTYLLETNCLNTAFAIQEHTLLTRKLYPRLANNEKDLYLHMSDYDYLGIFSEPSYGKVDFNILLNDFDTKAYFDPVSHDRILQIPRHFKVTIDKYTFTLPSAIIIRKTETGIFDVKFENQTFNNIFPIETNYINFNIYSVNQEETYIYFSVLLPEVDIEATEVPIEKSKSFRNTISFNPSKNFYYFRAFHSVNNEWKEMIVTHTEEVYDINTPTCLINVNQKSHSVDYYIPPVYVNTNQITGKVKFLIYTTNGPINVNFGDYQIDSFTSEYNPIFKETELNDYTQPLNLITKVIYLKDKIVGGRSNITFNELKNIVISNSIGDRKLPITDKQLEFSVKQNNFKLLREVDAITNRIFLLETEVPNSNSRYPTAKINLDLLEYKTTIQELKTNKNNVLDLDTYTTVINEGSIFELKGDELYMLTPQERTSLQSLSDIALVTEVNTHQYLSLMYTYIVDTSNNQIDLRPYNISSPAISSINFKEFNVTSRVGINTTASNIYKVDTGYRIDIIANFKRYIDSINETNITPYLVYKDISGSKFYLEGQLHTSINNQPVYRFELATNYYINKDNKLNVTNFRDNNNIQANIFLDLDNTIEIIYLSNIIPSGFTPSTIDSYLENSYLSLGNIVVTLEELTIKFGDFLYHLYRRIHTSTGLQTYQTYTEDVPLTYDYNVYDANNDIIHQAGDVVLDDDGNIVYKHLAGDLVLGDNGQPIPLDQLDLVRYMNLLFIDYRAMIATKKDTIDYREFIKDYITRTVTIDAVNVQKELLENTIAYVTIPKKISNALVKTSYITTTVKSSQSFFVSIHVTEVVYNDNDVRNSISRTVTDMIEEYLDKNFKIKKTELIDLLYLELKDFIVSINIDPFTELNDPYIEILDNNHRLSVNKILQLEPDGYSLKEDISVNFILV
jgi:hypothetical protein